MAETKTKIMSIKKYATEEEAENAIVLFVSCMAIPFAVWYFFGIDYAFGIMILGLFGYAHWKERRRKKDDER